MEKHEIIPIILAGGLGTRLWPFSRKKYPKQFRKFLGNNLSLFQQTVLRIQTQGNFIFTNPIIVTAKKIKPASPNVTII